MDINSINAIVAQSNLRVTWSITLIGASLAAILSTSYVKPVSKWWKLIYLLFVPGWVFLALAIHDGDIIARRGVMAAVLPERIPSIESKINGQFALLLKHFNWALVFFGFWLLLYLVWWIFNDFFSLK